MWIDSKHNQDIEKLHQIQSTSTAFVLRHKSLGSAKPIRNVLLK